MRLGDPAFICDGNCIRCQYNPTTCPVRNPLGLSTGQEADDGESRVWSDPDSQVYKGEAA